MQLSVSPAMNKRALSSHSWLGLLVALFMYWVCFSGTLAVFAQELVRWEQPQIAESLEYDPQRLQQAYEQMLQQQDELQGLTTMRLPTVDMPRAYLNANEQSWYITADGQLGQAKQHPITNFIAELHAELHLPHTIGELVVSVLGALLTALIITGVFAHRRIFKDAFRFRRGGAQQQAEADLHNRLSVWGLPFHLMIALTGAYFGLAGPLTNYYAETMYEGDRMALFADVYGGVPAVESYHGAMDLPRAFEQLESIAPETQPLFVTFERAGQDDQYLLLGSQHMDKLIYSEQYRFDAMGNYIDAVGYADGAAGQEAIFSVYRLHFGHFGGEWMKLIYGLLGLALTVVSVSGINLWLKKRGKQDAINDYWCAIVWGTPFALVAAALLALMGAVAITVSFWLLFLLSVGYALWVKQPQLVTRHLLLATAVALVLLVATHVVQFAAFVAQPMSLWVNAGLLLAAVVLALLARRSA